MFHLFALLKALMPSVPSQQQRDEAYLSEATDIYDVERRIAEIDHRAARPAAHLRALGGAL
jgi:hypothetical protein